jgi:pimeloyl-ACP methyl ester carboxylesterase
MPSFDSEGVRLHYVVAGPASGRPIVLVHGFASDYELNWLGSRWQDTLSGAGFRVLGLDCRGHGHSEKPHDPAAYRPVCLAADVTRLLDHLGIEQADYLGYSMGGRIGLVLASGGGRRLRRMVVAGVGRQVLEAGTRQAELIARRLRGDRSVDGAVPAMFQAFASSRPINDLEALACCIIGQQSPIPPELVAGIAVPVAVVAGDRDDLAAGAPELARIIPNAVYRPVAGRNHMNAVPARAFKEAALAFLAEI